MSYSVHLFGSDPALENDDCNTGRDFESLDDALAFFNRPFEDRKFAQFFERSTAFIELSGPNVYQKRKNLTFKPSRSNQEWKNEHRMQMGMMGGVEAYNDAC